MVICDQHSHFLPANRLRSSAYIVFLIKYLECTVARILPRMGNFAERANCNVGWIRTRNFVTDAKEASHHKRMRELASRDAVGVAIQRLARDILDRVADNQPIRTCR